MGALDVYMQSVRQGINEKSALLRNIDVDEVNRFIASFLNDCDDLIDTEGLFHSSFQKDAVSLKMLFDKYTTNPLFASSSLAECISLYVNFVEREIEIDNDIMKSQMQHEIVKRIGDMRQVSSKNEG